jgi:hypothetical protein
VCGFCKCAVGIGANFKWPLFYVWGYWLVMKSQQN